MGGPVGAGARIHVVPFASSAANLLLHGRKAWALFPPGRAPPGVRMVCCDGEFVPDSPPATWWWRRVFLSEGSRPPECIAFVQRAGDAVFTPNGWWHTTLNLSPQPAVALTQHVCSAHNAQAAVG